jgi:integrase
MPSFAKPVRQAERAVRHRLALGQPRHGNANDGAIHSCGTARAYAQALKLAAEWDRANGGRGLAILDGPRALAYLTERAELVCQKTLDLDRQALAMLPAVGELPRVRSAIRSSGHGARGRAYTPEQVRLIAAAQGPRTALATEIAAAAGLRAHELFTLRPSAEQPPSGHRTWSPERFMGLEPLAHYTVVGKGGLIREVALPSAAAERLEASRLAAPREVEDRGIRYQQHYDVAGGNTWSSSFSQAAKRALGWSTGAHSLRHSYAQQRMDCLQGRGLTYTASLEIVSQEMGHFRGDITEVYLR